MSESSNPTYENYRYSSVGTVKIYGNCVEIQEHTDVVTPDVVRNEVQREMEHVQYVNELFDKAFENHVMEYGQDFEKHDFWFNGKNYYPQENEKKKESESIELETPKRERGDIVEFSAKSRYRMLKKMNRLNPDKLETVYSMTLTYPKRFPTDGVTHKTDLDVFIKRLKRKFGNEVQYLWKLEFQKRGAPHYHIIVRLPKVYKHEYIRAWLSIAWYNVVQRYWDEKQENHLNAGTEIQKIENIRSASYYLCKYLNKELENVPENQGRFWGCSRNWGDLVCEASITGKQLVMFRRLVKKLTKRENKRMAKMVTLPLNLTMFGYWKSYQDALNWVQQVQ